MIFTGNTFSYVCISLHLFTMMCTVDFISLQRQIRLTGFILILYVKSIASPHKYNKDTTVFNTAAQNVKNTCRSYTMGLWERKSD